MPPPPTFPGRPLPPSNTRQNLGTGNQGSSVAPHPGSRSVQPQPPAQPANPAPEQASAARKRRERSVETFEERERNERIYSILNSWEKLAAISLAAGDSIPQTRLRYLKLLTQPFPPASPSASEREDDPDIMEIDPPAPSSSSRSGPTANPRSTHSRSTASQNSPKRLLAYPLEDAEWVSENEADYEETMKLIREREEKERLEREERRRRMEVEEEEEEEESGEEVEGRKEGGKEGRERVGGRAAGVARRTR